MNEMVDYQALGRRMKMKRRARHLSQEDVAKAAQISASYYGNIERGTRIPSIDTLVLIANALGVGADYLLFDSLKVNNSPHTPEEMRFLARYLQERIAELNFGDPIEDDAEAD